MTPKANKTTPIFSVSPVQPARDAVAGLVKGGRVIGVTKGQFSLIDLIKAILEITGPASLTLSTWTAGVRDVENVGFLVERGALTGLRLLVDRSFVGRQPQYAARVTSVFGKDAIRCTRTHAKFALIRNESWAVVVRSSMNLNRNPRLEQFDIDDDVDIYEFFNEVVEGFERDAPPGVDGDSSQVEFAFEKALGGGVVPEHSAEKRLQDMSPW